jgi:hypothetical protein
LTKYTNFVNLYVMTRWLVALAVVILGSAPARADDDPPFTIGSRPAWFVLGGVTGGGTIALADRGGFVGGELSVVRLREGRWLGLYADGYHDWGTDGTYVTGGLELGRRFFGIDGGAAVRFRDGETEPGATVRLTAGVGIFTVYLRYAWLDAAADDHVLQLGAMLKLPLMSPSGGH